MLPAGAVLKGLVLKVVEKAVLINWLVVGPPGVCCKVTFRTLVAGNPSMPRLPVNTAEESAP